MFQHHSVMAKGGCRATFVPFWKIREVMEKWPELDADLRAGKLQAIEFITIHGCILLRKKRLQIYI